MATCVTSSDALFNAALGPMMCCRGLTTAEDSKSGAVVFLNPLISLLDEHAYGSGSSVEVGDLQSLHHLPVPPYIHTCTYIH